MKITQKHFDLFKARCEYWINRFELNNWKVYFEIKNFKEKNILGDCNAVLDGYVATLTIAKEWTERTKITNEEIDEHAKHEVIHLLLARMSLVGRARFAAQDEHYEAEEELTRKITHIIKS